ncbi:MAG: molybdenum transporter ATP-binding protein [Glaciihabitans sp.]|nr:molybdenum transporter ATP-binding protein [Glaciihabitans sp.]
MSLSFSAALLARSLEVDLELAAGETVAILGPNGAGKSTTIGILAGLIRPDTGFATLDGSSLFDFRGTTHKWVPPHARNVSLLAQDPLLFPHLIVRENVAFGPRSAGVSRAHAHATADHWLDEVEASSLAGRKPAELSGGEAQRVAVARALATDPRLLLLDEPMAALDVTVAPLVRRVLRRVLHGRTVIIVTHDILDALVLADRVIVLNEGRIVDAGPTREVLERPRSRFAADLAGLNLLLGTRTATGMVTHDGDQVAVADGVAPIGARVAAVIRPTAMTVGRAGSVRFEGTITDLEPRGDLIRIRVGTIAADVTPSLVADLDLAPGHRVALTAEPRDVTMYSLD